LNVFPVVVRRNVSAFSVFLRIILTNKYPCCSPTAFFQSRNPLSTATFVNKLDKLLISHSGLGRWK